MNEDEIQVMIDRSIEIAIDKHNKSATIISAAIGSILLFFYAHGVISLVEKYVKYQVS
jgi:hypothetical protein